MIFKLIRMLFARRIDFFVDKLAVYADRLRDLSSLSFMIKDKNR